MKIKGERISYLADKITAALLDDKELGISAYVEVKSAIVRALKDEVSREELIEEKIKEKINSLASKVEEGSREWELLYRQYYEEEVSKRAAIHKEWF